MQKVAAGVTFEDGTEVTDFPISYRTDTEDVAGMIDRLTTKPCYIYLILALFFGIIDVFLVPPNGSPDESAHQVKIVRVANGNFLGINHSLSMPAISTWYGTFSTERMLTLKARFSFEDVRNATSKPIDCRGTTEAPNDTVAAYSPILYIVPATIYRLSCSLHAKFGTYLYAARLANLVVSIALVFAGISLCTTSAWPILYIGLLPCFVCQTASISADSLLFGLSALYIGCLMGIATREIRGKSWFILFAAVSCLLSFSKPSYVWMAMLSAPLLSIWLRDLGRASLFVLYMIIFPLALQATLLYCSAGAAPVVPGVLPMQSLQVLGKNPLDLFHKLLMVPATFPIGTQWNLAESFIGKLGYLNIPLPLWTYVIAYCGLLLSLVCNFENAALQIRLRIILISIFCISVPIVALPLYLYATPTSYPAVFGLQGRYFIPSAMILMAGITISFRWARLAQFSTISISALTAIVSTYEILTTAYN